MIIFRSERKGRSARYPGARSRLQGKESSRGSQATQNGYRVERAVLIGGRWSGGAGVAEARAAVGTRGVASLSVCSGADRGIGGRSVGGWGRSTGG